MTDEVITAPAEVSAPAQTPAPIAAETTQAATPAATETSTETTEAKQFVVPAKFLKEDGTPDYERLSKSYTELEKKISKKGNIPAASADEYAYDFGEGFSVDETATNDFKAQALSKGFTKDQYAFIMEQYKSTLDKMTWSTDKTEATLKADWGQDFDVNAKAARAGFDQFAPSDANPHDPVWNHPQVMKLLARMGAELGEDSLAGPKVTTAGASIDAQIAELRALPNSFRDPAIQAKLTALYEKKYK